MGKSKMDEAAAARIRKARGDKDEFAKRATVAARTNKENSKDNQQGGGSGGSSKDSKGGSSR